MTRFLLLAFFVVAPFHVFSQKDEGDAAKNETIKVTDSLFREDQFYFSISYNLVQKSPEGFKQFSFSPCFTGGFLRDFPVSKNRHWALAPGVGYCYTNIKQFISTDDLFLENQPAIPENIETRIITHSIELPLEIRWRNAPVKSHKFWRVYTGFKARYILGTKIELDSESYGGFTADVIDNVNKWQYGTYVSAGYNTWNLHVYYGLNPIFKSGSKLADLNFGFMFYIL
ncbi:MULTISPECIES: porin family protein [Flavobacterium]|uniref:porin family protein n=1 Tax=Flavobacterium TaxID=237 RepID=UPI001FCCA556|nr:MULTISPECIES: porin family protein [Flavobacterium]UOK43415.1 PorT family protein [Flavobacterium enshiense]